MKIAIATTANGIVGRFGHEGSVVVHDGAAAPETIAMEGCCGTIIARLVGTDVLLCTAIGEGALHHLAEAGIRVAMVQPGLPAADAVRRFRAGSLATRRTAASACAHTPHQHGSGDCSCH